MERKGNPTGRTRSRSSRTDRRFVDRRELADRLSLGLHTAEQAAIKADARFKIGGRVIFDLDKTASYILTNYRASR